MNTSRSELLRGLIAQVREFKFCPPFDDPEQVAATTSDCMYIAVQLQSLAGPLLPSSKSERLARIEVRVDDWESAYRAMAEIEALLPDIEEAAERADEPSPGGTTDETVDGVRQLLIHHERSDLAEMLRRSWFLFAYDSAAHFEADAPSHAVFRAPIEDCERLRALPSNDHDSILRALSEIHPWLGHAPCALGLRFEVDRNKPTIGAPERSQPSVRAQASSTRIPSESDGDSSGELSRGRRVADYQAFGYLCRDKVCIGGRMKKVGGKTKKGRNLVEINGNEVTLGDALFILLLRLAVELKKGRGGYVSRVDLWKEGAVRDAEDFRPYSNLRAAVETQLVDRDGQKFVQNDGEKNYRISTHPDFVTYDRDRLLRHPSRRVNELAKLLP